jgi:antitoxin component of RelBE/YafQ-DinJ toxin-antitoxin module
MKSLAAAQLDPVPEIRFRPSAEVYARAQQIADSLGLTVTDVARMGLTQLAKAREIALAPKAAAEAPAAASLRDLPLYGTTVGRIADIAAAAGRQAHASHVDAGRLPAPRKR